MARAGESHERRETDQNKDGNEKKGRVLKKGRDRKDVWVRKSGRANKRKTD